MRSWPLLLVLSIGCGDEPRRDDDNGSGSGAGAGTAGGTYQLCVDTINGYRDTLGLLHLSRWADAEGCSDSQAASDGASGEAHGAFGQCGEFAQNECPGWPGPPEQMITGCLDLMWDEGPGGGHHDAMASTGYGEVACGFHTLGSGEVWSVQNYR